MITFMVIYFSLVDTVTDTTKYPDQRYQANPGNQGTLPARGLKMSS